MKISKNRLRQIIKEELSKLNEEQMEMSFKTFEDNQPGVTVRIYEGENAIANKNHKMGEFNFSINLSFWYCRIHI